MARRAGQLIEQSRAGEPPSAPMSAAAPAVLAQGAAGAQAWPVALDAPTLAALETIQVGSSIPAGSNTIGKIDSRTLLNVRSWSQFHSLRSQRFIATTGYVPGNQNTATALALLKNPSGSGKVILLDQAEFGSSLDSRFSRYGGGTSTITGTKQPVGASDGSSATAIAELYRGGSSGAQYSSATGGTLRKVATMRAYQTYSILQIHGTAVLRPGTQAYWVMDEPAGGGNGTYDAFIDFEWVEMDETDFTALETAMAAMPLY